MNIAISSGEGLKCLELNRGVKVGTLIQSFLMELGISRSNRKNIFKGYVGVGRVEPWRKTLEDYRDTWQHIEGAISVDIFTGAQKVFVVVRFDKSHTSRVVKAVETLLKKSKGVNLFKSTPYSLNPVNGRAEAAEADRER